MGRGYSLFLTSVFFLLLIIVPAGITTFGRNPAWNDEQTLWEDVVAKSPYLDDAHYNLGLAYDEKGVTDDAMMEYKAASSLNPDMPDAIMNIGVAYALMGYYDMAIGELRMAIELNPLSSLVHYNIGLALEGKGMIEEAIGHYREAVLLDPEQRMAKGRLSQIGWDRKKED